MKKINEIIARLEELESDFNNNYYFKKLFVSDEENALHTEMDECILQMKIFAKKYRKAQRKCDDINSKYE